MTNANLLAELTAMAEKISALETETDRAVTNMESKIADERAARGKHLAEFIKRMLDLHRLGKFDRSVRIFCCGMDEEGTHRRSLALEFAPNGDAWFGRYFSGSDNVDSYYCYNKHAGMYFVHGYNGARVRDEILDRWNAETEEWIESELLKAIKQQLEKRSKQAVERLNEANNKYDALCKKEG